MWVGFFGKSGSLKGVLGISYDLRGFTIKNFPNYKRNTKENIFNFKLK